MTRAGAIAFALLLSACSTSHVDGGDDAGAIDCAPIDDGEVRTCPDGCTPVLGQAILESRACIVREHTVLACHPRDASLSRSGDVACFTRTGVSYRVWSSTGSIHPGPGEPSAPELITSQGWTRTDCLDPTTGTDVMPCVVIAP